MASLSLPIFCREALSRLDRRPKAEKASGFLARGFWLASAERDRETIYRQRVVCPNFHMTRK